MNRTIVMRINQAERDLLETSLRALRAGSVGKEDVKASFYTPAQKYSCHFTARRIDDLIERLDRPVAVTRGAK